MVEFNNSLLAEVAAKTLEKFKSLDKDGDGYVSREEFQNSILDTYNNNGKRLQGAHVTGTTIGDVLAGQDARFKQFDTAKDPKSKGLDFDEFSAMFRDEIYMEVKKDNGVGVQSELATNVQAQQLEKQEPSEPGLTKPGPTEPSAMPQLSSSMVAETSKLPHDL